MKILILGAHGFIGQNLYEFMNVECESYMLYMPCKSELDVLNYNELRDWVNNTEPDCVVMLADVNNIENRNNPDDMLLNVNMICNLARAYKGKIIYTRSGFADYSMYGRMNNMCRDVASNYKNIITLNLFNVYGKYEKSNRLFPWLVRGCINGSITISNRLICPTYVKDVCNIIWRMCCDEVPFNLYDVGGRNYSIMEIMRVIDNIMGVTTNINLGEYSDNYVPSGHNNRVDFNYTDVENGIRDNIDYYMNLFIDNK